VKIYYSVSNSPRAVHLRPAGRGRTALCRQIALTSR